MSFANMCMRNTRDSVKGFIMLCDVLLLQTCHNNRCADVLKRLDDLHINAANLEGHRSDRSLPLSELE
eukprot:6272962-Amphidinium_carterae.2